MTLLDLAPATREQFELDLGEEESERDRARLMQGAGSGQRPLGPRCVESATGRVGEAPRDWDIQQDRKSPDYITSW